MHKLDNHCRDLRESYYSIGLSYNNKKNPQEADYFCVCSMAACFLMMRSTTSELASVEMSPSWSDWLEAIFLRMRRMIFPERVFGRPGTTWSREHGALQ